MCRFLFLPFAVLILTSCGDDADLTRPSDWTELTEEEIFTRAYDGPHMPEDLIVDPAHGQISYVNSLHPEGRVMGLAATAAEARELAARDGFRPVGDVRETDLYFEFDNARENYGRPIVRVYRSSYLASLVIVGPSAIHWPGWAEGTVGPIVHVPLTLSVVQDLLDHIWMAHLYVNGAMLLERRVEDRETHIVLFAHRAQLVGGDWGMHDKIERITTIYTVEKATGAVGMTRQILPAVTGRYHPNLGELVQPTSSVERKGFQ